MRLILEWNGWDYVGKQKYPLKIMSNSSVNYYLPTRHKWWTS